MQRFSSSFKWWVAAAVLFANLAAGVRLYSRETAAAAEAAAGEEKSPYEMYALFSTVVEQIRAQYVDADKCGYQDLVYSALHGMLQSLDPHSSFMDEEEFSSMKEDTSGKFGGLGITIGMKNAVLTVIAPMEGTPAFRAGLLGGDKIIEIEDESTDGLALDEAVKKLRGDPGTKVKIKVFRPSTHLVKTFTITRAIINVPSVKDVRVLDDGIGYVRMLQFGENTAADLQEALDNLEGQGVKALVLDLRSNPGGLLSSAVEVAQKFLKRGDLIVFTRARDGRIDRSYSARPKKSFPKVPMAILINGYSASASEIVAGALQDHHRAVLVGEKSFGKGSVQSILPLNDGALAIRLTTAKYYTPSERVIHENGIEPDIVVPMTAENWRNVVIARNKAEQSSGDEEFAAKDDGWVSEDGGELDDEVRMDGLGEDEAADTAAGDDTDVQLERACDMLRGILALQGR